MRSGLRRPRPAVPISHTSVPATAAPAKAHQTNALREASENTALHRIIKKVAPALMPNRPGDASGLRVSACISAPATARLAPTASAISVRGNREVVTRICWRFILSCRVSAASTCGSDIQLAPAIRLSNTAIRSSSARMHSFIAGVMLAAP